MTAPLAPAAAPPAARSLRTRRNRTGRRPQVRLLFLLPAAVFLGLFGIFPLFQLVRMSLSKVGAATLNGAWQFTGLDNFTAGFASGESTQALYRTGVFVLVVTVFGMVGGLAAAIGRGNYGRWCRFLPSLMLFFWSLPLTSGGSAHTKTM